MAFYVYEFYGDSDKDKFLIEWLSDEQIATIAKVCDYDLTRTLAIGRAISGWNRRAERTCRPEVCDDGAGAWGVYCSECCYRFVGPYGSRDLPERMSGELCLRCGDHEVEGTVEEIEKAMALVGRLRRLGVEVGHAEIRVPIAEKGDEDGG